MSDQSFTSWKLDMLNGLSVFPGMKPMAFQIAYRIVSFMNQHTRSSEVSDARLRLDLGVNRSTISEARSFLEGLGVIAAVRGRYKQGTVYRLIEEPIWEALQRNKNNALDRKILKQDQNPESAYSVCQIRHSGKIRNVGRIHHCEDNSVGQPPHCEEQEASSLNVGDSRHSEELQCWPIPTHSVGSRQHIHLKDTLEDSLPVNPVSSEVGLDDIAIPSPRNREAARRIFLRYFGKGDPERIQFLELDCLEADDWIEGFNQHGLTNRRINAINAEIALQVEPIDYYAVSKGY